eukprot:TRINITY_DN51062_c0_g1_i1.p1 TRINITY_DN51062_c0_g1~~TRINITY_DN51062_c0_g1_i1.p1  ORF type:complete len:545 (-),score=105.19 TRINITY_DN51062_c0_g1_i1:475-2109(-)
MLVRFGSAGVRLASTSLIVILGVNAGEDLSSSCSSRSGVQSGKYDADSTCTAEEGNGDGADTFDVREEAPAGLAGVWTLLRTFLSTADSLGVPRGTEEQIDGSACNIERVSLRDEPSRAEAMLKERLAVENSNRKLHPVILTDVRDATTQAAISSTWGSKQWLSKTYGHLKIQAGPPLRLPVMEGTRLGDYISSSDANPVDLKVHNSSLGFDYQFKRSPVVVPPAWQKTTLVLEDKRLQNFLSPPEYAYQPRWLGLPFHAHGPVVNEVVSGKKLWLIYPKTFGCDDGQMKALKALLNRKLLPPELRSEITKDKSFDASTTSPSCQGIMETLAKQYVGIDPVQHMRLAHEFRRLSSRCDASSSCESFNDTSPLLFARWVADVLPHLDQHLQPTHRCVVGAGEMMVVPSYSWHATLNLEDSVIFVRGAIERQGRHPVPVCQKQVSGDGKVLAQLWNPFPEELRLFWHNHTSTIAEEALKLAPQGGTQELRTFKGLRFFAWRGAVSDGELAGQYDVGEPLRPHFDLNGVSVDVSLWDSCSFRIPRKR